MPENKSCVSCGREIPKTAGACVFCGTRQHVSQLRNTAVMTAFKPQEAAAASPPASAAPEVAPDAAMDPDAEPAPDAAVKKPPVHPSQTDDTLTNLAPLAREAVAAAAEAQAAPEPPASPDKVPTEQELERARLRAARHAGHAATRFVMIAAGVTLFVLFGMNATLLGAFGGHQLVLATFYLVGGVVLLGGATLPLPDRIRAAVATVIGAVPLFVAPAMVSLDGWRGFTAALVVLTLPGALLLRARVRRSRLARGLVALCIGLTALIYVVPVEGLVPVSLPISLLGTGSIDAIIVGAISLLPLGLVLATLSVFLPPRSTGGGNVWAPLVLLAVAGSVVMTGFAGGPRSDLALVHLGVGLLAAGATASLGVAQLLDVDATA